MLAMTGAPQGEGSHTFPGTASGVYERLAGAVGRGVFPPPVEEDLPEGDPGAQGQDPSRLRTLDPGRRGALALALVAVVVAVVAGVVVWRSRPAESVVAVDMATSPPASASSGATGSAGPPLATVVVCVSGRVALPGVVRLPEGARVADALEAAGGALPDTDLTYLNLARVLADGEQVFVGILPSEDPMATAVASAATGSSTRVNLNTASAAELETLPGIGPVLAQRIIDYRTAQGRFRSTTELRQVEGIGETRFERLKDLVAV